MKKCFKCGKTYDDSWGVCLECSVPLVVKSEPGIKTEQLENNGKQITISEIFNSFDLPFQHICQSVKKDLKSGIDPKTLIEAKQKDTDKILDWFRETQEWGRPLAEKYRKLFFETHDHNKYGQLQDEAIETMSAPWALSWAQYNIGECYEFLKEYGNALDAYKKSFTLWCDIKGWNGNGARVDAFKRIAVILSKMKDKKKFEEIRFWFKETIQVCPEEYKNHYENFFVNALANREEKLKD